MLGKWQDKNFIPIFHFSWKSGSIDILLEFITVEEWFTFGENGLCPQKSSSKFRVFFFWNFSHKLFLAAEKPDSLFLILRFSPANWNPGHVRFLSVFSLLFSHNANQTETLVTGNANADALCWSIVDKRIRMTTNKRLPIHDHPQILRAAALAGVS